MDKKDLSLSRRSLLKLLGGSALALTLDGCADVSEESQEGASLFSWPFGSTGTGPAGALHFGADSISPVSQAIVSECHHYLGGRKPQFWGRYFNHSHTRTSRQNISYRPWQENAVLAANKIRILPIFAQNNSGSSAEAGYVDGIENAYDFLATCGVDKLNVQGPEYLVFLNVEARASFSSDYYTAWADGLAQKTQELAGRDLRLIPCVYLNAVDLSRLWQELSPVITQGVPFGGAWIAKRDQNVANGSQYLDADCGPQVNWLGQDASYLHTSFPAPILLHQYNLDCELSAGAVDFSSINPRIRLQADLLNKLFQPLAA
jgi:hypothetical protein